MIFELPYEYGQVNLEIDDRCTVTTIAPRCFPSIGEQEIINSLRSPIASQPLAKLARGKKAVLIILENASRPLDTGMLLPYVLGELREGGVNDQQISILFANGAHQEMQAINSIMKLGKSFRVCDVHNHDCDAPTVSFGRSAAGNRIEVNPLVPRSDMRIAIGTVEPHHGAGTSGGAKMLFPGCASLRWIAFNHALERGEYGENSNQWRADIEESAARVGLDFIVNAVLNYRREIVGLYCGDMIAAHRRAQPLALQSHHAEAPGQYDVALCGASPFDLNFFQMMKAITPSSRITRQGGTYVLLAACPQGLGRHRWLEQPELVAEMRAFYTSLEKRAHGLIYSTNLSEDDLRVYMPEATELVVEPAKLRERVRALASAGSSVAMVPYASTTIVGRSA